MVRLSIQFLRATNVFNILSDKTPAEFTDMVKHHLKMSQLEEILNQYTLLK